MQELSGQRLEVVALEGAGGHGEVYRARLWPLGGGGPQEVALKALHPAAGLGPRLARLRYEARLLSRIDDPAIVGHIGLVPLDGVSVLIMEHVPGEDLATVLGHQPPTAAPQALPPRVAVAVCAAVARALHRAATLQLGGDGPPLALVHRDVKPANIRLTPDGGVKLLDFGVAKALGMLRSEGPATGLAVGTPSYLPPEQCSDQQARPASDVYALGVVLLEAISGARLFPGARLQDRVAILQDAGPHDAVVASALAALPPLPSGLPGLLRELLQATPDRRPGADQAAARLGALARELEGPTLAEWARSRSWPAPESGWGRLCGRWWVLEAVEPGAAEPAGSDADSLSLSVDGWGDAPALEASLPALRAVPVPPPAPPPAARSGLLPWGIALGTLGLVLLGTLLALS